MRNRLVIRLFLVAVLFFSNQCVEALVSDNIRIVSLAPNITEILYYLNAGDRIVGVTSADNYPAQVKKLSHVGSFDSPSLEIIAALKPDLILTCGFLTHPVYSGLKQLGVQVADYELLSLGDIYNSIDDIGMRIGLPGKPSGRLQERMNSYRALSKNKPKKKVAIIFWDDPLLTVGGHSYFNDFLRVAGCENVFAGERRSYFQTDPESIIASKPDVILLLMMNKRKSVFMNSKAFQLYQSSQKVQVVDSLDPDLFLRAGPRIADGVEQFIKVLKR